MTIKHARKLIVPGACLAATASPHRTSDIDNGKVNKGEATINAKKEHTTLFLNAETIMIESVLPSTPYLARLLSFQIEELQQMFPGPSMPPSLLSGGLPVHLISAIRPCEVTLCEDLLNLCQSELAAGRSVTLFKRKEIQNLCERVREFQKWTRAPRKIPPPTKRFTWQSLERLETQWCRRGEARDGPVEEYGFVLSDHDDDDDKEERTKHEEEQSSKKWTDKEDHVQSKKGTPSEQQQEQLIFGNVNVDPSLNLPNPSDARRLKYVDKRKRPQIQWMLCQILDLLGLGHLRGEENDIKDDVPSQQPTPSSLRLVDIGGGRGDLAMAVAAFFSQTGISSHVSSCEVTVIDNNESSLRAGQGRAKDLGLNHHMSFVLCDVSNENDVKKFLTTGQYHLIFGLHCCGGLSEAAVELALLCGAPFCISTCCFRSNRQLASLTRLSESMLPSKNEKAIETFRDDLVRVSTLATGGSVGGQHRAIRVLNSIRLAAAEQRHRDLYEDGSSTQELHVRQASFPIEFSVQNRVLIGEYR